MSLFNIFKPKVKETTIYVERVYITPDAKLVVHTLYRGNSPHNKTTGTKCLSTNDDTVANSFLENCEYLGDL